MLSSDLSARTPLQPYVIDGDGNIVWVHRPPLFEKTLFAKAEAGKVRFVMKCEVGVAAYDYLEWLGKRTIARIGLDPGPMHRSHIQAAFFENSCRGIRLWRSLPNVYKASKFSMQHGPGQWVQSNLPRWLSFCRPSVGARMSNSSGLAGTRIGARRMSQRQRLRRRRRLVCSRSPAFRRPH